MCGIVGLAGSGIQQVDLKVFTDIMKISTLRGVDGTGVFQGRFGQYQANTYIIEKKAWEVNSFFRLHSSKAGNPLLLKSVSDNVFIGHTRWATTGFVDDASCHPYHVKNLVGVHNGTMEDVKYFHKDKTDSLMFYEDIQRRDLKTVLEDADADSAYALSYFDMKEYRLVFARNSERPLFVAFHKDRKVMYWASESEFIECAASRHNLTIGPVTYFAKDTIYSILLTDIDKASDKPVFDTVDFKPRIKVASKTTNKYGTNYGKIDWGSITDWTEGASGANDAPFDTDEVQPLVKLTKAERKEKRRRESVVRAMTAKLAKQIAASGPTNLPPRTQCPKIPTYTCLACDKPLKLIDQWFADRDVIYTTSEKIFECSECKKLGKKLVEQESVTIQ